MKLNEGIKKALLRAANSKQQRKDDKRAITPFYTLILPIKIEWSKRKWKNTIT